MESEQHPVVADALTLMRAFVIKNSLNYLDFAQVWNEHKFYYIYCVGVESTIKTEMTDLMLRLGAHWFFMEEECYKKLAGLYFLYAVYFTQPCSPKTLIRVTSEQWKRIDHLHKQMIEVRHGDAAYVLCQLRAASAFVVCYSPKLLSLGPTLKGGLTSEIATVVHDNHISVCNLLKSIPTNLMMEYHQHKQELEMCLPPQVLHRPSLVEDIQKLLEDLGASGSGDASGEHI